MSKSFMLIAGFAAAAVLALPATNAVAAGDTGGVAARVPACPSGSVCLWPGQNYTGAPYVWYPGHGNVFLGDKSAALVDHVGSFVARTSACFIDTGSDAEGNFLGTRKASAGDYSLAYLGGFGRVMDRIAGTRYC
jgi:hypothetical protein